MIFNTLRIVMIVFFLLDVETSTSVRAIDDEGSVLHSYDWRSSMVEVVTTGPDCEKRLFE